MTPDKTMTIDDAAALVESGMTIGLGGWGSRRKPMALIRALLRSDVKDLTVVTFGGPDVGLLVDAGKVARLVYGFISLDSIPLDPLFTAARERGDVEISEYDEGMYVAGLRAAVERVDFLPTRAGLGSDVLAANPDLKLVPSPYSDESYVAAPALNLDLALVHVNRADPAGNGQFLGADPYFDDLLAMAAERTIVSAEQVVPTEALTADASFHTLLIPRMYVHAVVEAPRGAHFTDCTPDYPRDEAFQRLYAKSAKDPALWQSFKDEFLSGDESAYHEAVARFHSEEEVR